MRYCLLCSSISCAEACDPTVAVATEVVARIGNFKGGGIAWLALDGGDLNDGAAFGVCSAVF